MVAPEADESRVDFSEPNEIRPPTALMSVSEVLRPEAATPFVSDAVSLPVSTVPESTGATWAGRAGTGRSPPPHRHLVLPVAASLGDADGLVHRVARHDRRLHRQRDQLRERLGHGDDRVDRRASLVAEQEQVEQLAVLAECADSTLVEVREVPTPAGVCAAAAGPVKAPAAMTVVASVAESGRNRRDRECPREDRRMEVASRNGKIGRKAMVRPSHFHLAQDD